MTSAAVRCPRFLLLSAAVLLARPSEASPAQETSQEVLPLSAAVNSRLLDEVQASTPASEWNCLMDLDIAGEELRVLMPTYNGYQPDEVIDARLRRLTKFLVPDTVLAAGGQIGAWRADGTLYGVEFDVFSADEHTPEPAGDDTLPVVGVLEGYDAQGAWQELGRMYCYDLARWLERIDVLTESMGSVPPYQFPLWLGPLVHTSSAGVRSTWLTGTSNSLYGDLASHGGIRIGGSNQGITNDVRFGSFITLLGEHWIGGAVEPSGPSPLDLPPYALAHYLAKATRFSTDVLVTSGPQGQALVDGVPIAGTVYSTAGIFVEGNGIGAQLSLIAQESIVVNGSGNDLRAVEDGLLAWSLAGDVRIEGSGNRLEGSLFAHQGVLSVPGSMNLLFGQLVGEEVWIGGGQNLLSDGARRE